MSAGDGTKRARTARVLTNVSTLGEIHLMKVDTVIYGIEFHQVEGTWSRKAVDRLK